MLFAATCSVPRGTAFQLTGGGTDPDAGDTLTFNWLGTHSLTHVYCRGFCPPPSCCCSRLCIACPAAPCASRAVFLATAAARASSSLI